MELLDGSANAAEEQIMRSIELRRSAGEAINPAVALAAAAETALASASFDAADRLAHRALQLADELPGNDAAVVTARTVLAAAAWMQVRRGAETLADLLLVADDTAELAAAEERLVALQALLGRGAEQDTEALAETLSRLVRVSIMRGELDRAVQWQNQLIELAGVAPAAGSAEELHSQLVDLLVAADRSEQAVEANAALIEEIERSWGDTSAKLLPPLERQQELLKGLKRKHEARAVKKRLKKLKRALR
jgi:hypothetical protein